MLRIYSRRSLPHPVTAIVTFVLSAGFGFGVLHQVKSPDIAWTKKDEGMANYRWPYNRQFKLYSPTMDFTSLTVPKGNVLKIEESLDKRQ